ncbi:histidine kinase dimerization/phosphoacceptor domain -containing protein [Rhodospirillaceae bacterium SYSU D60014]|uniref:sensor histidine kinase n=1 Tax=Virgifigura deserti TaxID=2268457 RepID=UPI000E673B54
MADHARKINRDRLLEQMTAIARFGGHALRTDDLQALLQEASALAAKGLGVTRAMILEIEFEGQSLLVRAGIGWHPGVIGKLSIGAGSRSPAGHALQTGKPVASEDLDAEARFAVPEVLREHGVKSVANVVIKGGGRPFGVLEIDSDERRRFTREDIGFLQSYANLLAAAIDRLRTSRELAAARDEAALLLRELQHRVKNNLQTITSIVRIQKTLSRNPEAQRSFETLMNRLTALSLVHKQLYIHNGARRIALNGYLEELCSNLITAGNLGADDIKLDLRLERVVVPVDIASSLGLIVNEFVTNSMQHAFPDRHGTVMVALAPVDPGKVRLVLADNGVGRSQAETAGEPVAPSGLGLQLIKSLTGQIGGTIEWTRSVEDRGTEAILTFPV